VKETANRVISRVTGYHLVRGLPGEERQKLVDQADRLRTERDRARANVDKARTALAAARTETAKANKALANEKAARRRLAPDADDTAREIVGAVQKRTMTSAEKLFAFISSVRYVTRYKVPGDIVECGVWRGGSMQAAARTLITLDDYTRHLYLFDTFEGMPPPTDADLRRDGKPAAELLQEQDRDSHVWAIATLEDVQEGFAEVEYPSELVHYVKGMVEETVPAQAPEQISILRLDTDWYESTAHELKYLYDRLSPGGVLLLDDYGWWAGSRKAVDEFIDRTGEPLLLLRMHEGRVAVKPWRS
jgi:O-methyltransferase